MPLLPRCAVYYWAGQATIDLFRAKLPDLSIDESALREAHTRLAAERLAEMGADWAFLAMSWGFPPEHERQHWEEFAQVTKVFHDAGLRVLGYVQSSNCIATGSFARRDWYALTPGGRRIPYYRNRLMTCWNHTDWIAEVESRAFIAVDAGADGVFFDNLWMGATPWVVGGRIGGFAGCACSRCQAECVSRTGRPIPRALRDDGATKDYLAWRAGVVSGRFESWARAVRRRRPGALVLGNNCDVVLRDTGALLGLELTAVGPSQDALLVENVAMPRMEGNRLVSNALVIKAMAALVPGRPVMPLAYRLGIGLDGPPPLADTRRGLAETLACGAIPTVKGSEYLDERGRLTVLTAPDLASARSAVTGMMRFAAGQASLLQDASPDSEVAIYLEPGAGSPRRNVESVASAFATAIVLIEAGIPFRFVTDTLPESAWGSLETLVVPPGVRLTPGAFDGVPNVVCLREGELEVPGRPRGDLAAVVLRTFCDRPLRSLFRLYFRSSRMRHLTDRSGLTARALASPLFRRPRFGKGLLARLPPLRGQRILAERPVLAERWRLADGRPSLRLVNYADQPTRVDIESGASVEVLSPDERTRWEVTDGRLTIDLECLALVTWQNRR